MIQVIIISSFAAIVSIAVQASIVFKEKVISRRFYASLVLIIPCLLGSFGNQLSTYAKINSGATESTVIWSAIFSALVILINVWAAKQLTNTKMNPQIRTPRWTLSLFLMNCFSWIIYLISYEFLFRGYLFTSLLQYTTVENTFIVSITLYALAHLYKGEREFLLSVPFGFILCYITLFTENVWASVIIHCALAISNDVFAFRANPFFSISFPVFKKFRYEK
jgi:membrane protease YdiL (CAAX protease family)